MQRRLYLLGIFLLLGLFSTPGFGQPDASKTSPEDRQRAAALYEEAEARYKLKDYGGALVGYREAYRLSKEPSLLFLIGQCYRNLERIPEALESYRAYLQEEPDSSLRPQIERLISELEAQMETPQSLPASWGEHITPPELTPPESMSWSEDALHQRRAQVLFRVATVEAAVGLVLGSASMVCGVKARSLGRITLDETPDPALVRSWSSATRSFGLLADVFLAGALVSAGLGYLEHTKAKQVSVSFSPGGALLTGRF